MQEFSLLYPKDERSEYIQLGEDAINDLSVQFICERLSENVFDQNIIKNIMTKLERNPAVIRYRRDVFDDIYHYPDLRETIKKLLEQLDFLKELERSVKDNNAPPIWQLINRLQELDVYINCISGIYESLSKHDIRSDGLLRLKEFVSAVYNESGFEHLHEDIKDLVKQTGSIKSMSLGVNLDSRLMPVEVGIVSINTKSFSRPGLLNNFINFYSKQDELNNGTGFDGMTKIHTVGKVSGEDPLMSNLSRVVTEMLSHTVKQLKTKLGKYTNISGYSLTKLIPEFIFYIRWADYLEKIAAKGLPLCKPEVLDNRVREIHSKGLYNLKLAIQNVEGKEQEIVGNELLMDAEHRIYIMTGPNRGGKTTYTQAAGLACMLAQCGIYVPAKEMSFSPVDCIYTHFPVDENKTMNLGRLGEESKRMSEIFASATDESLLLFNESLATTSLAEGLYIAKDVVRALRYLGARTIFNTHMHELAMNLDELNTQIKGDSKVASLITGIHEGKRSYKVYIAPPEGVSYAQDVAKRYGVTFDQLMSTIDSHK